MAMRVASRIVPIRMRSRNAYGKSPYLALSASWRKNGLPRGGS